MPPGPTNRTRLRILPCLVATLAAVIGNPAHGHGGVVEEDDVCVIRIGYLKAHFKVYQPQSSGHEQFCEDLPGAGESVFVMEYLHDEMATLPIEFRIIRNTTGKGRFTRWEDVRSLEDIDAVTVFYREPAVEPDVFMAAHFFDADGDYVGIVTVGQDTGDGGRTAVFPFAVGFTGFGWWPYLIGLAILAQLHYLFMSGRIARWRGRRGGHKPGLRVLRGGLR